jgi:hypothetical protein
MPQPKKVKKQSGKLIRVKDLTYKELRYLQMSMEFGEMDHLIQYLIENNPKAIEVLKTPILDSDGNKV